jgi:hypothetical protein
MTNKKFPLSLVVLSFAASSLFSSLAFAADKPAPDAAKAAYPMTTCIVSGDKLGEMGSPVDYVYKQPGKPDRLVRFCCKDCIADFEKDPVKYLQKLDEGAAAKPEAGKSEAGHADHKH